MIGPAGSVAEGGWNGFNVLHTAASRVAALDLGFLPGKGGRDVAGIVDGAQKGEIDLIYLLGADEFDRRQVWAAPSSSIRAATATPARTRRRDPAGRRLYRKGRALRQFRGPGAARPNAPSSRRARRKEDWAILRALSDVLGKRCLTTIAKRWSRRSSPRRRISRSWTRRRCMAGPIRATLECARRRRAAGYGAAARRTRSPISTSPTRSRGPADHGRMLAASSCTAPRRWRRSRRWRFIPLPASISDCPTAGPGSISQVVFIGISAGRAAAVGRRSVILADRKIWAAVQMRTRPQRGGPLRPAAVLRRRRQVHVQGAGHPGGRQQGDLPPRAAGQRARWPSPPGR